MTLTSLLAPMLLFSAPQGEKSAPPAQSKEIPAVTPAFDPLPGHRADFVVDGEFLWWFPNIANTDYALKRVGARHFPGSTQIITPATDKEEFDWHWDPGFRVGAGVVTNHDGWDAYLNWTYFHSRSSKLKQVAPFESVREGTIVYTSPWFFRPHNSPYNRIKAEIGLNFNQIDLEKGRHFWMSRHLSMRPSIGLRGYWTRMTFSVKGNSALEAQTVEDGTTVRETTDMKQKSWGVGLLAGLENVWHFSTYFSIFATADVALTYGKVKTEKHITFTEDPDQLTDELRTGSSALKDQFYRLQPILDLALGLRFEMPIMDNSFRILADLGYEYHYLYDHNQFLRGTTNNPRFSDQVEANGDLSMTGLVLRGRFEF